MNKEQWITAIKKLALEEYGFTVRGIEQTDWECWYDIHADDTPEQALDEELTSA